MCLPGASRGPSGQSLSVHQESCESFLNIPEAIPRREYAPGLFLTPATTA